MPKLRRCLLVLRANLCLVALTLFLFASAGTDARAASVPNPTLSGPIASPDVPGTLTHNYPFFASNHDLAKQGYVEQEYYVQAPPTVTTSHQHRFPKSHRWPQRPSLTATTPI